MKRRTKRITAGVLAVILMWNLIGDVGAVTRVSATDYTSEALTAISEEDTTEVLTTGVQDIATTQDVTEVVTTQNVTEVVTTQLLTEGITESTTETISEVTTELLDDVSEEQTTQEMSTTEVASVENTTESVSEEKIEMNLPAANEVVALADYSAANSVNIPQNVDDLVAGTRYYVRTYDDVLALQELSKQSSLEGYTFEFAKLNNSENIWDLTVIDFEGLGSEEYPFKGELHETYSVGTSFKMAKPIFHYVASGAIITNFNITLDGATSGLADYLLIEDSATALTCNNVILSGTISNPEGNAGALYGTVQRVDTGADSCILSVEKSALQLSNVELVSGKVAGGMIGEIQGNVTMQITSGSNVAQAVTSTAEAAGGLVGKLSSGSSLTIENAITIDNIVSGEGSIGGLVGVCQSATVTSGFAVTKTKDTIGTVNVGGFAGLITDSAVEINGFLLGGSVRATNSNNSYAGGVIGQYSTTTGNANAKLIIAKVGVNGHRIGAGGAADAQSSGAGGVIGYVNGVHVTIQDIAYDDTQYAFLPDLRFYGTDASQTTAAGATGGIVGRLSGKFVDISNIDISFVKEQGIAGYSVGNIVGYVEATAKARLTDITITGNYICNAPEYHGGLIGYVESGCLIALCGTIDVSSIGYLHGTGTKLNGTYKGYVAGAQLESLIYLDCDAQLLKNELALDPENETWITTEWVGTKTNYTIDDIGTYGGVYRNIVEADVPVIQYELDYGQEITGEVTHDGNAYVLENSADALRLAIALNTFSSTDYSLYFGKGCFLENATAQDLLVADYLVTGDLNLQEVGVFSLCRNDWDYKDIANCPYVFTGTMTGQQSLLGGYPVITQYVTSKQTYAGLFPMIKDATFANLTLSGNVYFVDNYGGIAAFGAGSLTFENVVTDMTVTVCSYIENWSTSIHYYGGLLGSYDMTVQNTDTADIHKLICTEVKIAPIFKNIRRQQVVGGIIGYIKTGEKEVSEDNIFVDGEIGSRFYSVTRFSSGTNALCAARVGGMFAYIGHNIYVNGNHNAYLGGVVVNNTYARLKLTDIVINQAVVDFSQPTAWKTQIRVTGGLLGYHWNNVEVKMDSVKVTHSEINSLGHVGGLLSILAGKMEFGEIAIDGLTMTDCSDEPQTFSGLLIGDGRFALVTLDSGKYTITDATITGYSNFDEIVGVNYRLYGDYVNINNNPIVTYNGENLYDGCGIVNIIMPEFANMKDGTYTSYQNQLVTTTTNQYTRYYYNLFTEEYENNKVVIDGIYTCIDTPEKLMLWHLYQYAHSNILRFLSPYFVNTAGVVTAPRENIKLTGTVDMTGYSFYPTYMNGCYINYNTKTYGTLILCGEVIENLETGMSNKSPSDKNRQHYLMHAGLFYSSRTTRVYNITLQGTASNVGDVSGALYSGASVGSIYLGNIICDGLRLANYNGEEGAGLLIGKIADESTIYIGESTYDVGVQTTNYDTTSSKKAASALIGSVGSDTAVNVRITFINMALEDEGHVFEHASFIYYYDTTDNADENKSVGLYTFTDKNCENGIITYGEELSYGVDYFNRDRTATDELTQVIEDAKNGRYIPYVYKEKQILINPKNGNLTEGCGTYEDPYIISNRKQLLTLYCYLTGSSAYNNIFTMKDGAGKMWQVNPIGGGAKSSVESIRCNLADDNDSHTPIEFDSKYPSAPQNGFPSRDDLRKAYYLITDDLDLSAYSDLNEYVMNKDFAGLGTSNYPFSGVLVGDKGNGISPTITFPKSEGEEITYWANYGLIQCMKGAVVKNINIQCSGAEDADGTMEDIRISQYGGGVAAVVLGGDNIIDNVTVNILFSVADRNARTGGYVGVIKKGSVIIRNMERADIAGYEVGIYTEQEDGTTVWNSIMPEIFNYQGNSRVIGKVEDGCVLAETDAGDFKLDSKVLNQVHYSFDDELPLSYSFPIINGDYLAANSGENSVDGKLTITGNITDGFTIAMQNEAQLEIAAIALNSDAFAIYNKGSRDTEHLNGYDYTAVCRKADYTDVGCGVAGRDSSSDFQMATSLDDNVSYYPYLYYQYMDFTALGTEGYQVTQKVDGNKRLSMLNWSDGSDTKYGGMDIGDLVTTYVLKENATYDMREYGNSFRGFGGLYPAIYVDASKNNYLNYYISETVRNKTYSLFSANFNGNHAVVKVSMSRDWDEELATIGFFNNLIVYREAAGFKISNLTIEDSSFINTNKGVTLSATGAIAGYLKGVWNFENIVVQKTTTDAGNSVTGVQGNGYTGGLVGVLDFISLTDTYMDKQNITFTNCKMISTLEDDEIIIKGNSGVGGLLGHVNTHRWNICYQGTLVFEDCQVMNANISTHSSAHMGGFVGIIGEVTTTSPNITKRGMLILKIIQSDTEESGATIKNVTMQSESEAANALGGLVGEYLSFYVSEGDEAPLTVKGVRIDGLNLYSSGVSRSWYGIGGLFGGVCCDTADITDVKVMNASIGYQNVESEQSGLVRADAGMSAGGLIGTGYSTKTVISGTAVTDSKIVSYTYTGGFFGFYRAAELHVNKLGERYNCIQNNTIYACENPAGGVIGAYMNMADEMSWFIDGVQVLTCDIRNIYSGSTNREWHSAGGVIGRFYPTNNNQEIALSDIVVGEATEIEGYWAGGLIAHIQNQSATGIIHLKLSGDIFVGCSRDAAGVVQPDVNPTTIYGRMIAGGLYGLSRVRGKELCSADVQIHNARIGAYVISNNIQAIAGGIAGYRVVYGENNETYLAYNQLTIADSVIAVNRSGSGKDVRCGGLYGVLSGDVNESKICLYNPKLKNNSIGYCVDFTDVETLKLLTGDEVNIIKRETNNTYSFVKANEDGITEDTLWKYTFQIGNYLGQWTPTADADGNTHKQLYILRPELTYSEDFNGARPAIDIANQNSGIKMNYDTTLYGRGYPYDWRKDCHIVYFNPSDDVSTYQQDGDTLFEGEGEYLYTSIDEIVDGYNNGEILGKDYLDNYKLKVLLEQDDLLTYYNNCAKDMQLYNVPVVYADGGSAQNIIDGIVGILTNVGGIYQDPTAACMTDFLDITAHKAKITKDGKIVSDESRQDCSLVVTDNAIQYKELVYDTMLEDESYSITLLRFRYGWIGADDVPCYETLYVPVHVVERIALYSKLAIMEGEQYSLAKTQDATVSYDDAVTVAHDSTYTLFTELAYGEGRYNAAYDAFQVNKGIRFQKENSNHEWEETPIPKGMKFTLVDVETQKAYYYTVESEDESIVDFTQFKSGDTEYVNRAVGAIRITTNQYEYEGMEDLTGYDIGLERFFIYVEPPEDVTTMGEKYNSIFRVSITTTETSDDIEQFLDRREHEGIQITWLPGMQMAFEDKGTSTKVAGNISLETSVEVDARIQITANTTYWAEKNQPGNKFIDSENNNKYLDVAIYLIDKNTNEYVSLPEGTNIIIDDREPFAAVGQSVTYMYKDQNKEFPIKEVQGNLTGECTILEDSVTGELLVNYGHIELDFSVADLDDYMGKTYDVYLSLLRTSDPDYPLGGKEVDYYSKEVQGLGRKELAVAVSVDDLMALGINTYQQETTMHKIPFTTKLDFSDLISDGRLADIVNCASNNYLVTYRLKKKIATENDSGYSYVLVDASDAECGLQLGDELVLMEADDTAESGYTQLQAVTYAGSTVFQTVKTFTENDFDNGNKVLFEWDLMLQVNTENLANVDLSNYMVEVTVLPYDSTLSQVPETDQLDENSLEDYFIFTIGKIKTDM